MHCRHSDTRGPRRHLFTQALSLYRCMDISRATYPRERTHLKRNIVKARRRAQLGAPLFVNRTMPIPGLETDDGQCSATPQSLLEPLSGITLFHPSETEHAHRLDSDHRPRTSRCAPPPRSQVRFASGNRSDVATSDALGPTRCFARGMSAKQDSLQCREVGQAIGEGLFPLGELVDCEPQQSAASGEERAVVTL